MDIMGQILVYNIVAVNVCMYILYGVFWLEYYCSGDQPRRKSQATPLSLSYVYFSTTQYGT